MRDSKHPRQFTEDFKRQIVALVDSSKPRAEVMRECDLGNPHWTAGSNGSMHAAPLPPRTTAPLSRTASSRSSARTLGSRWRSTS